REFPALFRMVDPLEEAAPLFLTRDVQEELDHVDPVLDEVTLPFVDLAKPAVPELGRRRAVFAWKALAPQDLRMDAHDEHLLVMRPIEDADDAPAWERARVPPEVVVIKLFAAGDLERGNADPLGVETAHDVLDGAVLPRGIDPLQHDEDRIDGLGRELHLEL